MIASVLFFLVIAFAEVTLTGSYTPYQQSISGISSLLFSTYIIPFELLSVVLVSGIIGMFHTAEDEE
jgi:NADH-quinone oxidoreductase subunit J